MPSCRATDQAVSDVTLQANQPVVVERHGRLFPVTRRRLAPAEVYHLTQVIYGDNAPSQLAGGQDIDCSYEIPRGRADLARYRVNMTAVRAGRERGVEITVRTIATTPPPLATLDLPPALRAGLERWLGQRGLRPVIRGEFDDNALLKMFGRAGEGFFAAPDALSADLAQDHGMVRLGAAEGLKAQVYALSAERRLAHPAVLAIRKAAQEEVFT